MSDCDLFSKKYRALYRAMIEKDGAALDSLLDEGFILVHITGMRQNKKAFIRAVEDGTLNYFSEELCDSSAHITGAMANFIGKSIVSAAVFGGGRHAWRLQLEMKYIFAGNDWLISEAVASTW